VCADISRHFQTYRGFDGRLLTADQLVGRADELRCIERVLDELDRGRPGAVELVGEPGIGKTRLLKEIGLRAELRACLVLTGSASEPERALPFSVFVDAVDEYVKGLEPQWLAALDDSVQAELSHVLPSMSPQAGGRPAPLQHERYRSHRAVKALLEHLAETKPLVLLLDDVHWADMASVELLSAMMRRPPSGAVLLALARRPRHGFDPLSVGLDRAQRAGTLTRIELSPLTRVEAKNFSANGPTARTSVRSTRRVAAIRFISSSLLGQSSAEASSQRTLPRSRLASASLRRLAPR
jgi:predicted ATPase